MSKKTTQEKDFDGTWQSSVIFAPNCDSDMEMERVEDIVLTGWLPGKPGETLSEATFDFSLNGYKNAAGQTVGEALAEAHYEAIEKIIKAHDEYKCCPSYS